MNPGRQSAARRVTVAQPQLEITQNGLGVAFPIMAAVFLFFTVVGAALPVLPLQVHNVLGFGPFVVGIVAGCQFVAALVSRLWAGRLADSKGAKYAVRLGLCISVAGGCATLHPFSLWMRPTCPWSSCWWEGPCWAVPKALS